MQRSDIIKRWPRDINHILHFENTNKAFLYAKLIHQDQALVADVRNCFNRVTSSYEEGKKAEHRHMQRLLNLVFKRQFLRECLEEIDRLNTL